jgi:hypothetical protein
MKINDLVSDIEGNLEVENLRIQKFGKSFQIYPWLKGRLFHKYMMGTDVLMQKSKSVLFSQITSLFYGWWNIFRKYNTWVFTNSSERTLVEGKYYDKLFDYIGNNSKKKTLLIELRLFNKFPKKQVASKYVISKSLFILIEEVYARFLIGKIEIENEFLIPELEKKLECSVSVKEITRKYLAQYRMMQFWLKILPKPKVVYLTVSYSNFGYIRAFKEKGIKVIEMQHGLIGLGHYAYYYRKNFEAIQFPDEIGVFGEREVEFFKQDTEFPVKKATPIGRYVLDFYKENSIENTRIKLICISLQDGDLGEKLIEFLLKANSFLKKEYKFIIQPRRTSEGHYRDLFELPDNYSFSTQSIYQTIAETDVHITIFSTTAVEALSIGKPNILVNIEGKSKEFLGEMLNENEFTNFVDTEHEFCSVLDNLKVISNDVIALSNNLNIKSDYKKNMNTLIDRIENEYIEK